MADDAPIKLQILLRPTRRNPEAIAEVQRIAQPLGIRPTASGAASISAEIDRSRFKSLFGKDVQEVQARASGSRDFGAAAGFASGDLTVPEPLREYVQSITVAPAHIRMSGAG